MKFNFDWLLSPERKKLRDLKIQNEEKKGQILDIQMEIGTKALEEAKNIKPYKNLRMIDKSVTVVLNDGIILSKSDGGKELFDAIKGCYSESAVIALFAPPPVIVEKKDFHEVETKEEKELVRQEWDVLKDHPDFEVVGDDIFFKGVSMPLPAMIVVAFIEIVEKINDLIGHPYESILSKEELEEQYTSLKLFTLKLALNPIQSSREDALRFVKQHDIRITSLGNLVMYRAIVSVGQEETPKALTEFVSNEYLKVKKWKKSPANYTVGKDVDGAYSAYLNSQSKNWETVGNLAELYDNLSTLEENRYTDAHTGKMDIRVGSVYSIPEEQVDINSRDACSSGLHVGTKDFGFSSFGDTRVLCLVNPAKIRSIPYEDANKMRVSEMFIAAVIKDEEMFDEQDLIHFDEKYHNLSLEELYKALEDKDFSVIKCQDKTAPVTQEDVQNIADKMKEAISSRVVNV